MPARLIHYEAVKGEKRWTYELKLSFNKRKIIAVVITDHYQQKDRITINNEMIIKLLKKLDNRRLRPIKHQDKHTIYKWETIYQNQAYRLIFWFKDNTKNHLWIRNFYPIN